MGELRKDMLPDQSETSQEVEETPILETEVLDEPQDQVKPPKGYVPHEALVEERKMRKQAQVEAAEAEARLNSLSSSELDEEEVESEPSDLEARLAKLEKDTIYNTYPNLTDKRDEFETFLEENPHYPIDAGAKIFMAENDMFEKPKRKGLERPTAGPKTPAKSGLTIEEIKDLRENHPRKYMDYLKSGKIKFDELNLG